MPKRRRKVTKATRLVRLRGLANKLERRVNVLPWNGKAFNTAVKRLATVEDEIWKIQNR